MGAIERGDRGGAAVAARWANASALANMTRALIATATAEDAEVAESKTGLILRVLCVLRGEDPVTALLLSLADISIHRLDEHRRRPRTGRGSVMQVVVERRFRGLHLLERQAA